MVGWLLLILKWIGIILVSIIGIVLGLLLIILLVPIRYQIEGTYEEKLVGVAKVSWLLHIFSFQVQYEDELNMKISIFGIPIRRKDEAEDVKDTEEVDSKEINSKETDSEAVVEKAEDETREIVKEVIEEEIPKEIPKEKKKRVKKKKKSKTKLEKWKEKWNQIKELWTDEANQKTLHLVWKELKGVIKHIFPKKIRGKIKFGFDDPYKTGQVLQYISPFYGKFAKTFTVIPVFEETIIEGRIQAKGRIVIGYFGLIAWKLWRDKNLRKLIKKWRS